MSIREAAQRANGNSRFCSRCPIAHAGRCTMTTITACSEIFIDAFVRGAKYARKH